MDAKQIAEIRETWACLKPLGEGVSQLFYQNLFTLAPEMRSIFHSTNMTEQNKQLVQALNFAVDQLERPDVLIPVLQDLGERHASYGVSRKHFDQVGAALIQTLKQGLSSRWDVNTQVAWTNAYATISSVMIDSMDVAAIQVTDDDAAIPSGGVS